MNRLFRALPALLVLGWAAPALAGGYDTPMLYSARHMGMGGAAIGWVNDPSALFHNPAGLGHVRGLSLMGDFSPLIGTITGSPQAEEDTTNIESDTTFAPFFLVGAAYGITDWLTVGLAVYPVASAGATYKYTLDGADTEDHTRLVFIEATPGFAVNLPQHIRIGAGYRINTTTLERTRKTDTEDQIDLDLSGFNFFSFRIGAQWTPIPELELGLVYRHRTITDVEADEGTALGITFTDVKSSFTLPTRLGFGARGNFGALHAALDLEYALNSQNVKSGLSGQPPAGDRLEVFNQFRWSDALTLRVGVEYRLMEDKIATRLGYVFDAKTANTQYPSAFGTPPGPTHVLTIGGGYDAGPWEVNLAYAYRFGTAEVTEDDIGPEACLFCGGPGDYAIGLHGIYVDFSIEIGGPAPAPPPDPNADLVQPEPSTSAPPANDGAAPPPDATTTEPASTEPAPADADAPPDVGNTP